MTGLSETIPKSLFGAIANVKWLLILVKYDTAKVLFIGSVVASGTPFNHEAGHQNILDPYVFSKSYLCHNTHTHIYNVGKKTRYYSLNKLVHVFL